MSMFFLFLTIVCVFLILSAIIVSLPPVDPYETRGSSGNKVKPPNNPTPILQLHPYKSNTLTVFDDDLVLQSPEIKNAIDDIKARVKKRFSNQVIDFGLEYVAHDGLQLLTLVINLGKDSTLNNNDLFELDNELLDYLSLSQSLLVRRHLTVDVR